MTRAANGSRLKNVKRIPQRNLSRTDSEYLIVESLCALSADELLLACFGAGLRAVSLHTGQLVARKPTALRDDVLSVAFDAHTDTLLLVVGAANNWQLVSLRRNASEWLEVQRLNILVPYPIYMNDVHLTVCDSRVLFGRGMTNTLYVFDVSAAHTLREAGSVSLQTTSSCLACTRRDNDTLVAFAHYDSVSLQRLTSPLLRLEQIASVKLTEPRHLVFVGDQLLVADLNDDTGKHAIVSLRATGNALSERRVLLNAQRSVYVSCWTLAGDKLVIVEWDSTNQKSGDLHVLEFV